jgi:hypothetical protein
MFAPRVYPPTIARQATTVRCSVNPRLPGEGKRMSQAGHVLSVWGPSRCEQRVAPGARKEVESTDYPEGANR